MIFILLVNLIIILQAHGDVINLDGGKNASPVPHFKDRIMFLNSSSLSITSALVNHNRKYSAWVDYLLGSKSVFWRAKTRTAERTNLNEEEDISLGDLKQGHHLMRESLASRMPHSAFFASCSIEFLGFGWLESNTKPFSIEVKHEFPSVGRGQVTFIGSETISWPCFYRATYDNWRNADTKKTQPNFWPIFLYCFPPQVNSQATCNSLRSRAQKGEFIVAQIELVLRLARWKARVRIPPARWMSRFENVGEEMLREQKHTIKKLKHATGTYAESISVVDELLPVAVDTSNDLAVCTCLPYLTSDADKVDSVNAILYEWVRYYTKMGIKVFLYDRDGIHASNLFGSAYARESYLDPGTTDAAYINRYMEYYNYSILGILDQASRGRQYDNTLNVNADLIRFDNDHTLTLTHCRFEAKARYGIENVIAIDFDEFLHCRLGGTSSKQQSTYIRRYLARLRRQGYDQATFPQNTQANKTEGLIKDCVADRAASSLLNSSIFDCIAPYSFAVDTFAPKSVHLTHVCPLTTDHHASPLSPRLLRIYDCLGVSFNSDAEECSMMHFTLRPSDYTKPYNLKFDYMKYKDAVTEPWFIANAKVPLVR